MAATSPSDDSPEPSAIAAEPDDSPPRYPAGLIATAVALPVLLVVVIVVAAVIVANTTEPEPLVLGAVPVPEADSAACSTLLAALPAELGEFTAARITDPVPAGTRAWQRSDLADPIVLRCGVDRPYEFHRAATLQSINQVEWFQVQDPTTKASTWFVVDRESYIALTVPSGVGPTPLQVVSDTITAADLKRTPIDPGPIPN